MQEIFTCIAHQSHNNLLVYNDPAIVAHLKMLWIVFFSQTIKRLQRCSLPAEEMFRLNSSHFMGDCNLSKGRYFVVPTRCRSLLVSNEADYSTCSNLVKCQNNAVLVSYAFSSWSTCTQRYM